MACGKHLEVAININRLEALGQALDLEQQLSVFHEGFVGFSYESEVNDYAQGTAQRSAARPRPGQRTTERTRRGEAGEAHRFRSGAIEEAFGTEFRILARDYSALGFEDRDGLWVMVKSNPLGSQGPQIHFAVAFPLNRIATPRGWAFSRIGPRSRLMSLKHTNFPDASICAFLPNDGSWKPTDGMTALIDHYSVWAVKSLHRQFVGYWPGKQYGACALYRRMEFEPREWCGCLSGKRYQDCHQGADLIVSETAGRQEFRRLFRCDYETRAAPVAIVNAAMSRWKKIPAMASVVELP